MTEIGRSTPLDWPGGWVSDVVRSYVGQHSLNRWGGRWAPREVRAAVEKEEACDELAGAKKEMHGKIWRNVLSAALTKEQRNLSWLAVQDRLETRGFLYSRQMVHTPKCPRGYNADETAAHVMVACPFAQEVWRRSKPLLARFALSRVTARDVMWGELRGVGREDRDQVWAVIGATKELLWKARKKELEGSLMSPSLSKSWSYVGRQGGGQDLSLVPGKVTKGTVLHELMHALGFHHEHCRSDRDDHVWVLSENIKEEWKSQIVKMKSHAHDVSTPYDCSSIMHYSMTAGSVDERNPTIIPKNPLLMLHMGHGNSLSPCDVAKVQKLYGYETTLPLSSTGVGDCEGLESQVRVWRRKTEQELKEEKEAKEREFKTKAGPVGEIIRELRWLSTYDGSTMPRLERLLELLSSECPAQEKEALHTAYRDDDGPKVLKRILEFPKAEADRISLLLVLNKILNAVAVQTAEKGSCDKRTIEQAFQEFRDKTCIRFTPRTQEDNYINFQALDGSWSFLGKKGGAQSLSLEPGKVTKGTVLHELMHALGFQHEHCRRDRDKYIKINEDNVKEGEQRQFQLLDTDDCELPYDYISITHYGRDAFSGDGISPTIIPIPDTTTVSQRDCLSPLDVVKIRKMYKTMVKGDIIKAVAETAVLVPSLKAHVLKTAMLAPTLKAPVPEVKAKAEATKQDSWGCAIM
uniref:Metalloendopeptidase n=1 Tax=Petromyzon marinus TaxID=7757 RepID=A0AAJ7WSM0_PETMA|nr:uncharacterized protein LOC116941453 [Petromyzon marinus]